MAIVRARIAHLSDLHFGPPRALHVDLDSRTVGLPRAFNEKLIEDLGSHLVAQQVDLVVCTGDIANNPLKKYLRKALNFLVGILDGSGLARTRLVVLPGNHDVSFLGNLGFKPVTSRAFRRVFSEWLGRRYFLDAELGLFLYWFDSNPPGFSSFARGDLDPDELRQFSKTLSELYGSPVSSQFSESFKITMLHHHPMPIPHSGSDRLLMLDRSGSFLYEMLKHGVDLVLHGHKHRWGFSKVRFHGKAGEVAVLAGGTAGWYPDEIRYNVITLFSDGTAKAEAFRVPKDGSFEREDDKEIVIVDREEAKDRLKVRVAKSTGRRYKSVSISVRVGAFGDVDFRVLLEGLVVEPEHAVDGDFFQISPATGYIRAFTPNMVLGGQRLPLLFRRLQPTPKIRNWSWQVDFGRKLRPDSEPVTHEHSFRILNGLMTNQEEARFSYGTGADRYEAVEIRVRWATEKIGLVVGFESPISKPEEVQLSVLDQSGQVDETASEEFRRGLEAPSGQEIRSYVRGPYAAFTYVVRWPLPPPATVPLDPVRKGDVAYIRGKLLELREDRARANVPGTLANVVHEKLTQIASELREMSSLGAEEERIDISLMVWDEDARVLRIVAGLLPAQTKAWDWTLSFGDGLAGRAMKLRKDLLYIRRGITEEWDVYISPEEAGEGVAPIRHEVLLSMPVVYWGESLEGVLGVLNIGSDSPASGLLRFRSADSAEESGFKRWAEGIRNELVLSIKRFLGPQGT